MKKTINQMIKEIEHRVCIREIWRCNAGWGIMFHFSDDRNEVYSYENTLEACVKKAWEYWVLKKDFTLWPKR